MTQVSGAGKRWVAAAIFSLASTLNYLDRTLLASVAPLIIAEFHLTNEQYGWLGSGLGLAYALASPVTGLLLDRWGLQKGTISAVALWSAFSAATPLARGMNGLMALRIGLGAAESAGIPAYAKMNATYLRPEERAVGAAVNQVGLTLGQVLAPALVYWMLPHTSWRGPFVVAGALGFLWLPLWLGVSRAIPPVAPATSPKKSGGVSWLDPRMLVLAAVNILWMGTYVLWSLFTPLFLVHNFHETTRSAATYSWFPPVAGTLGGFFGGWLSLRLIRAGTPPVRARIQVILVSALGCLASIAVPYANSSITATALIGAAYFAAVAGSVNIYTIPLDLFGSAGAATATSVLVCAYGILQTFLLPLIGRIVDRRGYGPACVLVALPPVLGWLALRLTMKNATELS